MNLAIIGLGNWGKKLLVTFNKQNKIKYCHTSGDLQNIQWVKKNFPKIKIVKNIDEILNDEKIDAVIIASPINTHHDFAKKSLLSKKHVFVEKPLSKNFSEAKSLFSLAKKNNLCLFVGNIFLYHPVFYKLKKLLSKEKIQSISGIWLKTGTFGEDIILNLLYHEISLVCELFGTPKKLILNNSQKFASKSDILDIDVIFNKKIKCNFYINRISNTKQKSLTIITNKNCYLWENEFLYKFSQRTNSFKKIYESKQTALENESNEFIKNIRIPSKRANSQISLEVLKTLGTVL